MGKFSKPKTPKVKEAPDPAIAQQKADEVAAEERRRLSAGGFASTILGGALGDAGPSAANVLLGAA